MPKVEFKDEMAVVSASVLTLVSAGRAAGLSNEAAVLAALIGIVSIIRVDCLDEERLVKQARHAVPQRQTWELLSSVPVR